MPTVGDNDTVQHRKTRGIENTENTKHELFYCFLCFYVLLICIMSLLNKILGDPNDKEMKRMREIVQQINDLEPSMEALSDDELTGKTIEFKQRVADGASLDDILPEAFAVVREAAKRVIGMRHYDVQLLAGITLHRGFVAEMRTGEGKTLVATLPAYLNALTGKGVHIVTVNDYLAIRDTTWMGEIYHALGLTVACIQNQGASYRFAPNNKSQITNNNEDQEAEHADNNSGEEVVEAQVEIEMKDLEKISRQEAYKADILHGTNNEFGFDYLRDNMAQRIEDQVQRGQVFAIVDEVDSILIDEARTPLIISAPSSEAAEMYQQFARIVPRLKEGEDYNIDEKMRAATLTEEGINKVEKALGIENLYAEGGIKEVHHLENALRAQALFERDKEYVVKDGEVIIVDEFTGRLMYGRRYSDGLHQAIEAKENVPIQQESVTMATITFQNYFRMYEKLSGMTGTAKTEEEEFAQIYGLSVLEIPTNRPIARDDKQDLIFKNEKGKFEAVIDEIKKRNEVGQPVLVGTVSIEHNEHLSTLLTRAGVKHEVLNAKNHLSEAAVIAQAGRVGAVTIATNMAGRGVDIVLGGHPRDPEQAVAVKNLGGLHVIGTERHESRRIDNQLRGRSGRQGDPGSSQFFISTEDDLMRIFGSDRMKTMMDRLGVPDNMPIENKLITRSIEQAQKKVEGHNFDIRKHVVQYDDVINKQREVIYRWRQQILEQGSSKRFHEAGSEHSLDQRRAPSSPEASPPDAALGSVSELTDIERDISDEILDMVEQEIESVIRFHTQSERESDWNVDEIYEVVDTIFPVPLDVRLKLEDIYDAVSKDSEALKGREALIHYLFKRCHDAYDQFEKTISDIAATHNQEHFFENIQRSLLLRSIDTLWVEHLDAMDHLRQGIGLRGYGQRDPLVEYKREAFGMFERLQEGIRKQVVYSIFKIGGISGLPSQEQTQRNLQFQGAQKTLEKGSGQFAQTSTAPSPAQAQNSTAARMMKKQEGVTDAPVDTDSKVGRNDPCPCGAINPETHKPYKYKKCGMINAPYHKG